MIARPPGPTLFPYTTLFRSGTVRAHDAELVFVVAAAAQRLVRDPRRALAVLRMDERVEAVESRRHLVVADRKSTRLNSSHLGISYAVFCLKKKNNQERMTHR